MIERKVVTERDFRLTHSHLIDSETYFIGGISSIYVPSSRTKYLNEKSVKTWPDISGIPLPMTPGEAARTELDRAFPDHKRVGWRKEMIKLFDWRSPMHYSGPHFGDMVMIDLKSAYYEIYRRLWLDTPFPRGFGSLSLARVGDALKGWKAARNSVVGVCASRSAVGIKGNERKELFIRNKYLSPGLWASVQAILHSVASRALHHGALYVNTDGYIFPWSSSWDDFGEELGGLALPWEFRAMGDGVIAGWNSYKIDDKSTHIFRLNLGGSHNEFSNIKRSDQDRWFIYLIQTHKLSASPD